MQQGISPIYEQGLEELMYVDEERLSYTTEYKSAYKNADAIFIGVGTPEQPDGSANLSYIATVARQIAETLGRDFPRRVQSKKGSMARVVSTM